jgi:hypothetical protein
MVILMPVDSSPTSARGAGVFWNRPKIRSLISFQTSKKRLKYETSHTGIIEIFWLERGISNITMNTIN